MAQTCCPTCGSPILPIELAIDASHRVVAVNGVAVRLQPKQMELLLILRRHAPNFVHRDRLIFALWQGEEPESVGSGLAVQLTHLRKALRSVGIEIENSSGQGWRIKPRAAPRRVAA